MQHCSVISRSLGKKPVFSVLFSSWASACCIFGASSVPRRIPQHRSLGASGTWVYEEAAKRPAVFLMVDSVGMFEKPKSSLSSGYRGLHFCSILHHCCILCVLLWSAWEGEMTMLLRNTCAYLISNSRVSESYFIQTVLLKGTYLCRSFHRWIFTWTFSRQPVEYLSLCSSSWEL